MSHDEAPTRALLARGSDARQRAMELIEPDSFRFGEFELDLHARELRRHGRELTLSAKSMQVLEYLLRNRGRVVTREEILDALWPATRVATGSLTQAVWETRRVLSQQRDGDRMITTLRGRGYRFDSRVTPCSRGRTLGSALECDGGADFTWPQPLRQRLRMLSSETQSVVIELAMFLARHRADALPTDAERRES